MVELRLMVNDPKTGKTYKKVLPDCREFVGKKIGDNFSGDIIGLKGFELKITGGSDDSGFPMRKDLSGSVKRRLMLSKSTGLGVVKKRGSKKKVGKVKRKGLKKRKTVRGNTVGENIAQINSVVVKGEGVEKFFAPKEEAKVEA